MTGGLTGTADFLLLAEWKGREERCIRRRKSLDGWPRLLEVVRLRLCHPTGGRAAVGATGGRAPVGATGGRAAVGATGGRAPVGATSGAVGATGVLEGGLL